MRIPNIDGIYETKGGDVKVTVTRKEIDFHIKTSSKPNVIIIEDDTQPPPRQRGGGGLDAGETMSKISRGLTGISEALIGKG